MSDIKKHQLIIVIAMISFGIDKSLTKLGSIFFDLNQIFPFHAFFNVPKICIALNQSSISDQTRFNTLIVFIYAKMFILMCEKQINETFDFCSEFATAMIALSSNYKKFNCTYMWSHLTIFQAGIQILPKFASDQWCKVAYLYYFFKHASSVIFMKEQLGSTIYHSFIALTELQLYTKSSLNNEYIAMLQFSRKASLHLALAETIVASTDIGIIGQGINEPQIRQ